VCFEVAEVQNEQAQTLEIMYDTNMTCPKPANIIAAGVEAALGSCLVLKEERSWHPSQGDGGHLMEKPRANVWCVENAGATFLVCSPENGSPDGKLQ